MVWTATFAMPGTNVRNWRNLPVREPKACPVDDLLEVMLQGLHRGKLPFEPERAPILQMNRV